jgi:hypothetical protein
MTRSKTEEYSKAVEKQEQSEWSCDHSGVRRAIRGPKRREREKERR